MRSVRVLIIGAVAAAAAAVPAVAAVGGSGASPARGQPQPPLCQTAVAEQLRLSARQTDGVAGACKTFANAVAAADRASGAQVAALARRDSAAVWQLRQRRRTAVWSARAKFQATVHGELGIPRRRLAAQHGRARGHGRAAEAGPGRGTGQHNRRAARQGRCRYAQQ